MNKVTKQGEPPLYVENVKNLKDFLPQGDTIISVKLLDNGRKVLYKENGWYTIEETNKSKGVYIGDICAICGQGEVVDAGGCATCSRCNAQLKCGL